MKSRLIGTIVGGLIGAVIGTGTEIVGGFFGAIAGMIVFTIGGAIWGFSAGPDLANQITRWQTRRNSK